VKKETHPVSETLPLKNLRARSKVKSMSFLQYYTVKSYRGAEI
jgi:hypothetical protein